MSDRKSSKRVPPSKRLIGSNSVRVQVKADDLSESEKSVVMINHVDEKNLLSFRLSPLETNNDCLGANYSQPPLSRKNQAAGISDSVGSNKLFSPSTRHPFNFESPSLQRKAPSISLSVHGDDKRFRSFVISTETYTSTSMHVQPGASMFTNSISEEFNVKLKRIETEAKKAKNMMNSNDFGQEGGFQFIPVDLLTTAVSIDSQADDDIEEIQLQ
jgi:hypothetical protein